MNRGAVAELAAFKIRFSLWAITWSGTGLREFEARRGGVVLCGATLDELAQRIGEPERNPPS